MRGRRPREQVSSVWGSNPDGPTAVIRFYAVTLFNTNSWGGALESHSIA